MATKIYESFLGGGDGYTKAQRTGLQRSAEIKKRRKEEERAFERSQEASKSRAALTERGVMEAGETRRAGMGVAGGIEEQRLSNVGMMARGRLAGELGREAATTKAIREADVASMKYGRGLTTAELKHKSDVEVAGIKARDPLAELLETSSGAARTDLNGKKRKKRSAWSEFDY